MSSTRLDLENLERRHVGRRSRDGSGSSEPRSRRRRERFEAARDVQRLRLHLLPHGRPEDAVEVWPRVPAHLRSDVVKSMAVVCDVKQMIEM